MCERSASSPGEEMLVRVGQRLDGLQIWSGRCGEGKNLFPGRKEKYRGADKSLARPGRKQAIATEDFDVHISYLLSKLEEY